MVTQQEAERLLDEMGEDCFRIRTRPQVLRMWIQKGLVFPGPLEKARASARDLKEKAESCDKVDSAEVIAFVDLITGYYESALRGAKIS